MTENMSKDWKRFKANVVNQKARAFVGMPTDSWPKEVIGYCRKCENRWVNGCFHNCYTEGCQTPDSMMKKPSHRNIHQVLFEVGLGVIEGVRRKKS